MAIVWTCYRCCQPTVWTPPPYGLGFMGKDWDHGVPGEHYWREVFRVAKPGAHLVAFGGTRMFHRLMVAIEDAGWEIRDTLMWMYGSGLPKSLDVSKAIDAHGGRQMRWFGPWLRAERERRGMLQSELAALFPSKTGGKTGCVANWELGFNIPTPEQFNTLCQYLKLPFEYIEDVEREIIGHREGTALAVAPGQGEERGHVMIPITEPKSDAAKEWDQWGTALKPAWEPIVLARKPLVGTVAENVQQHRTGALNIAATRIGVDGGYTNHTAVVEPGDGWRTKGTGERTENGGRWPANVVLDEDSAALVDEQSGELKAGSAGIRRGVNQVYGHMNGYDEPWGTYGDTGGASRFFYTAKASRSERHEGLPDPGPRLKAGSLLSDVNALEKVGNHHPCVKPVDIMAWLCRLITPPGGTVLDPFAGSGSTGCAAVFEGFQFIGMEKDQDNEGYIAIAEARLEHWHRKALEQPLELFTAQPTQNGQQPRLDPVQEQMTLAT